MLDDRLRTGAGGELANAIRDAGFRGPVIALAGQADVYRAAEITLAGADHYLLKQDLPGPRLLAVLRGAVDHARISGPERPAPAEQAERQDTLEKLARLTPRESQVLDEIVLGLTNQQIADKMHRSVETIKVHRSHIMSKMQAQTTADLVRRVVTARLG
jgi:FixJ family two-component response regulator